MHNAGTTRIGEKLAAVADEPARGYTKFQTHTPIAIRSHTHHLAPPRAEFLGDHRWGEVKPFGIGSKGRPLYLVRDCCG
jgi:hypothetical protein